MAITAEPLTIVAAAASCGSTVVSSASHLTMLSRVAKNTVDARASTSPTKRRCSGRSRSPASAKTPSTISTAPATSAGSTGSSRIASAIVTATSGPAPAMTAARDAPTSFTAMTYKSCEPPGAMSPVSEKRPEIAAVGERVQRERGGHTQRDQTGDERSRLGVRAPLERDAQRRRHRPEEDGGDERQDDRGHRARLASRPETVEAENGRSAQVSCRRSSSARELGDLGHLR